MTQFLRIKGVGCTYLVNLGQVSTVTKGDNSLLILTMSNNSDIKIRMEALGVDELIEKIAESEDKCIDIKAKSFEQLEPT